MSLSKLLYTHVGVAAVGILAIIVPLYTSKGKRIHKRTGLFALALMGFAAASGFYLSVTQVPTLLTSPSMESKCTRLMLLGSLGSISLHSAVCGYFIPFIAREHNQCLNQQPSQKEDWKPKLAVAVTATFTSLAATNCMACVAYGFHVRDGPFTLISALALTSTCFDLFLFRNLSFLRKDAPALLIDGALEHSDRMETCVCTFITGFIVAGLKHIFPKVQEVPLWAQCLAPFTVCYSFFHYLRQREGLNENCLWVEQWFGYLLAEDRWRIQPSQCE